MNFAPKEEPLITAEYTHNRITRFMAIFIAESLHPISRGLDGTFHFRAGSLKYFVYVLLDDVFPISLNFAGFENYSKITHCP